MTGRKLQERRLKVWARNPNCAQCGKLCDFPAGFELDHKVPLHQGGEDTEANCQVLCVRYETINGQLVKVGCHARKTAQDAKA
ncbi:HNH endonuclease [Pseudomonas sp. SP16.1]|uniref:HNH endonuclease n=1 Tax=Pseudomonas sp. SP16.1 TaxID=3458854 RepID=UPI004045D271